MNSNLGRTPSPSLVHSLANSRQHLNPGDWSPHLEVFQNLCQRWGKPDVDLLASRIHNKLDGFIFRCRDPLVEAVDALVICTTLSMAFLFFLLLTRLLHGIEMDSCEPHSSELTQVDVVQTNGTFKMPLNITKQIYIYILYLLLYWKSIVWVKEGVTTDLGPVLTTEHVC